MRSKNCQECTRLRIAQDRPVRDPAEARVLEVARLLCSNFYRVVDDQFKSYCVLTSTITQAALAHYAIESTLLPCQMVHITDESAHFVGFSGRPLANQWDGHVVVLVRHLLLDFAVGSLSRYHGIKAPRTVIACQLPIRSNLIARVGMGDGRRLLWVNPPPDADPKPPPTSDDLVKHWTGRLIERLSDAVHAPEVDEAGPFHPLDDIWFSV